jgi:hypothetical protein
LRAAAPCYLDPRMRGRHGYPLLAGAIAALAAAGCGGDNSAPIVSVQGASGPSGANGAVALSKPDFIKQGDAICGEANAALAGLSGGTTAGDQKTQTSQELQITRSELDSLQSLTPPDQDRSTLDKFLSGLQNEVSALTQMRTAVDQGGDTSSADAELTSATSNAESAAADYGFKDCANGASQTQPATSGAAPTAPAPTAPAPTAPAPTATTPAPVAPAAPPAATGGTGGGATGGATGGGTSGGTSGTGGTSGGGGVSP